MSNQVPPPPGDAQHASSCDPSVAKGSTTVNGWGVRLGVVQFQTAYQNGRTDDAASEHESGS
jgi:hypothetical protein